MGYHLGGYFTISCSLRGSRAQIEMKGLLIDKKEEKIKNQEPRSNG
jgi:hypothetical protein